MAKRNKDILIDSYSENYIATPDGVEMIVSSSNKPLRYKLDKAEELFKCIYQWLISNDALEEESEEDFAFRVINEIPHIKEDINTFFRDTV